MSSIPLAALSVHPPEQPDVLGTYAKVMQLKQLAQASQQQAALAPGQQQIQQQTIQSNALGLQQKQKEIEDQQKIEKIITDSGDDIKSAIPKIMAVNPQLGIAYQKSIMESDTATLNQKKALLDYHGKVAERIAQVAGTAKDQQSYQNAIADLLKEGTIDVPTATQFLSQPFDPAKVEQIRNQALTVKEQLDQKDKEITEAETQRHNKAEEGKVALPVQEAQSWLAQNPGKTLTDYEKYKAALAPTATFNVNNQAGGGLNDAALDQAAERYAATGVLPAMGMGAAGAASRKAIMNRAGELHPQGSIAVNSAEYKANQASLQKIQTNFDQVNAFENTAGKNLDVFLGTAKKAIDSGSPWVNRPLRSISAGALGSQDLAAFNAARQTALTEIAKVLNSSNASGVLSDSARSEVSGLIGPDATLKQIYSAANILKQDMANRKQSYQDQIKDIQGRLGGAQGGGPTQSGAPSQSEQPVYRGGKLIGYTTDGKTISRLP